MTIKLNDIRERELCGRVTVYELKTGVRFPKGTGLFTSPPHSECIRAHLMDTEDKAAEA
jgi:hypothetical protein